MSKLLSTVREIDCSSLSKENLKLLGRFYDQLINQPINFQIMKSTTLNIELVAKVRNFFYLIL